MDANVTRRLGRERIFRPRGRTEAVWRLALPSSRLVRGALLDPPGKPDQISTQEAQTAQSLCTSRAHSTARSAKICVICVSTFPVGGPVNDSCGEFKTQIAQILAEPGLRSISAFLRASAVEFRSDRFLPRRRGGTPSAAYGRNQRRTPFARSLCQLLLARPAFVVSPKLTTRALLAISASVNRLRLSDSVDRDFYSGRNVGLMTAAFRRSVSHKKLAEKTSFCGVALQRISFVISVASCSIKNQSAATGSRHVALPRAPFVGEFHFASRR